MQLRLLGTAAAEGFPGIFCECDACLKARELGGKNIRTRSSLMINEKYKIDFPPDTYLHVLKYKLDLSKLEHLLITHAHEDHFYPDDLRMRRYPIAHLRHNRPLHVYGDKWVLERMNIDDPIWAAGGIIPHLLEPYREYQIGEMTVTTLRANHFPEKSALNYVFQLEGKTVLYGCDSTVYREETWEVLRKFKLDVAFIDSTNGILPDSSVHAGIEGVKEIKRRLIEQGSADENTRFIATHFSHNGGIDHEEFERRYADANIEVGYDGMLVEL